MTAQAHAHVRFRRAIERRALWMAERGSPKYETAALRWLERYLSEASPRLRRFAELAQDLASHLRIEERELEGGKARTIRYP